MRAYFLFILFVFYFVKSGAQDLPENKFHFLTTADGLSDPSANVVYKDHEGIIWIGTRNGLNKYDGETIQTFGLEDGLTNTYIYEIVPDPSDSLLWLGTRGGLFSFNLHSEGVQAHQITDSIPPRIPDIKFDQNDEMWLATSAGLIHYNEPSYMVFKHDSSNKYSILDDYVMSLLLVGDSLLVGSYLGLNSFNPKTKTFRNKNNSDRKLFNMVPEYIQCIMRRKNGQIWISAFEENVGGLAVRIDANGTVERYVHNPSDPNSLTFNFSILSFGEDANGLLWIGTNGGGISVFNDASNNFHQLPHDPKINNGLNDLDIWNLYLDDQHILWVSTDGGGVNMHHTANTRFSSIVNNPFDSQSIESELIMTFADTDSALWVGTNAYNGLSKVSKITGKVDNYPFNGLPNQSLRDNTVYDLAFVEGKLWIATHSGGVSVLDLITSTFEHLISNDENRILLDGITSTLISYDDKIFLGTEKGLAYVDRNSSKVVGVTNPNIDKELHIEHMMQIENDLWLATKAGIYLYSLELSKYIETPEKLTSVKNITYLLSGRNIWIGTLDGLWRYDPMSNLLIAIDGLSNNCIQGLAESGSQIWVTTKKGLNILDKETNKIQHFTAQDGLTDDFFNLRAIHVGTDGIIYTGGNKGINYFDPSKIVFVEETVLPKFKSITILDEDELVYQKLTSNDLQLNHDQSTFNLDFYVPDYINPDKAQYKYRIVGLSDQFFEIKGKSEINITDLSQGSYQVEVYATNIDGIWSNPATLSLTITPPFWATWYALLLYALVLVGLFFGREQYRQAEQKKLERIIEDRTQKVRKQAEEIKKLDEAKTRFFSNISHEFRTPLTLIQGPIQTILADRISSPIEVKKNLNLANRNVGTLRNLIDEILEFNKIELGELRVNYIPVILKDYLDEFGLGYEALAKEKEIEWTLNHEFSNQDQFELALDKVEKVLHNLLSNALKNTPEGGSISLSVVYNNDQLHFEVKDNGSGIAKVDHDKVFERFYQSSHGKLLPHSSGIGLAYVKEISEALGGSILLESEEGDGSTFTFSIPSKISQESPIPIASEQDAHSTTAYAYGNNKILLVEDNEEMASYIQQTLGNQFELRWAKHGQEALEVLEDYNADLIISDIMMPIMDGLELLSRIKSDSKLKLKSVIMLTAKSSYETRIEALSFGLDDYLTKPFSPLELEIRVKNLLRNQYERFKINTENENEIFQTNDPLIEDLIKEVEDNLDNRNFGVLDLANKAAMSDRQLTRVTKKAVGLTPALLIREVKLRKAKSFLEAKKFRSLAEISSAVGFEKATHFGKLYFERFGKKPIEYLR